MADLGASSVQGSIASIFHMSVTMHSAQWVQFDYDLSCFVQPAAVVGPWTTIINHQMEDDEDDSIISTA
jgi:hypothetical protein